MSSLNQSYYGTVSLTDTERKFKVVKGSSLVEPGYVWAPYVPIYKTSVNNMFDDLIPCCADARRAWTTAFPPDCRISLGDCVIVRTHKLSKFGALGRLNGSQGIAVAWDDWTFANDAHRGCEHGWPDQANPTGRVIVLVGERLASLHPEFVERC